MKRKQTKTNENKRKQTIEPTSEDSDNAVLVFDSKDETTLKQAKTSA
jgi:hypothetical protein